MLKDSSSGNPLTKLYKARRRALSEFADLPVYVQTVLVANGYTRERLENEISTCALDPDKLPPNLGAKGFEAILAWLDYK